MFGADTSLVMDALQIAALAAVAGSGAIYLLMRRRNPAAPGPKQGESIKTGLEERVQVLERIATDRSIDLADEIEALRTAPDMQAAARKTILEGQNQ